LLTPGTITADYTADAYRQTWYTVDENSGAKIAAVYETEARRCATGYIHVCMLYMLQSDL